MKLLSLACVILLIGCSCRYSELLPDAPEQPRWFLSSAPVPRGAFLVVHGLNQRPSAMEALCRFLNALGFHAYRLTLSGHDRFSDETFPASQWREDVARGAEEVQKRFPALPLSMLGYSLGGLLTVDALDHDPNLSPQQLVLVAPALSLRTVVLAAKVLQLLPATSFRTANFAPPGYRRFSGTPLFWYSNTADIYDETRTLAHPQRLAAIPALVLISPDDELVSAPGVGEWIDENGLSARWKLELVGPQPADPGLHRHLIVDEASVGRDEWRRMQQMIGEFLKAP